MIIADSELLCMHFKKVAKLLQHSVQSSLTKYNAFHYEILPELHTGK